MINISAGNRFEGFDKPYYNYNSLDEFISSFPFAERQCILQIENELQQNGYFIFSDFYCPLDFKLTMT